MICDFNDTVGWEFFEDNEFDCFHKFYWCLNINSFKSLQFKICNDGQFNTQNLIKYVKSIKFSALKISHYTVTSMVSCCQGGLSCCRSEMNTSG